jgi:hypothetical protein
MGIFKKVAHGMQADEKLGQGRESARLKLRENKSLRDKLTVGYKGAEGDVTEQPKTSKAS